MMRHWWRQKSKNLSPPNKRFCKNSQPFALAVFQWVWFGVLYLPNGKMTTVVQGGFYPPFRHKPLNFLRYCRLGWVQRKPNKFNNLQKMLGCDRLPQSMSHHFINSVGMAVSSKVKNEYNTHLAFAWEFCKNSVGFKHPVQIRPHSWRKVYCQCLRHLYGF